MYLNRSNINRKGKLSHLIAPDLFQENIRQVFAAQTGKYLGVIQIGQQIEFNEPEEIPEFIPAPNDENQLSLF